VGFYFEAGQIAIGTWARDAALQIKSSVKVGASPHLVPNFSATSKLSLNSRVQDTISQFNCNTSIMNSLSNRAVSLFSFPSALRPIVAARLYATHTGLGTSNAAPQPRRKAVTPFNDDGRLAWGDLSVKEKAARTTQQTFNFGFIILGACLTVCILVGNLSSRY